jgi:hypothetical protein
MHKIPISRSTQQQRGREGRRSWVVDRRLRRARDLVCYIQPDTNTATTRALVAAWDWTRVFLPTISRATFRDRLPGSPDAPTPVVCVEAEVASGRTGRPATAWEKAPRLAVENAGWGWWRCHTRSGGLVT